MMMMRRYRVTRFAPNVAAHTVYVYAFDDQMAVEIARANFGPGRWEAQLADTADTADTAAPHDGGESPLDLGNVAAWGLVWLLLAGMALVLAQTAGKLLGWI